MTPEARQAVAERIQFPGGPVYEIPEEIAARLSRPSSEAGQLQRAAFACLLMHRDEDNLPTGGRFLFYELEQAGIVSKSKINGRTGKPVKRSDAPLVKALTRLREEGIVPWGWITDESRNLSTWAYAATVADFVRESVPVARIDLWAGEDPPLTICESKATAGVLTDLASEYLCPIAPTGGQCGGFLHTDLAPILVGSDRPILYLGDYDLAGGHIEANTQRVLESVAGPREWKRIGITPEQIEDRNLAPIEKKDKRFNGGRPHKAWEVEALGQGTVKQLLRDELDARLPEPIELVRDREQSQQDEAEQRLKAT